MAGALEGVERHALPDEQGRVADQSVHAALIGASGTPLLLTQNRGARAAVAWTTIVKQRACPLQRDPLPDHRRVFEAVAAGDTRAAHTAMPDLVDMILLDTRRSRLPKRSPSPYPHILTLNFGRNFQWSAVGTLCTQRTKAPLAQA